MKAPLFITMASWGLGILMAASNSAQQTKPRGTLSNDQGREQLEKGQPIVVPLTDAAKERPTADRQVPQSNPEGQVPVAIRKAERIQFKQVPNITLGIQSQLDGVTWEREDAKEAHYRGLVDDTGRLMAILCHNTDLGDGWERVNANEYYAQEFSLKKAFPMGINIVVYALTH